MASQTGLPLPSDTLKKFASTLAQNRILKKGDSPPRSPARGKPSLYSQVRQGDNGNTEKEQNLHIARSPSTLIARINSQNPPIDIDEAIRLVRALTQAIVLAELGNSTLRKAINKEKVKKTQAAAVNKFISALEKVNSTFIGRLLKNLTRNTGMHYETTIADIICMAANDAVYERNSLKLDLNQEEANSDQTQEKTLEDTQRISTPEFCNLVYVKTSIEVLQSQVAYSELGTLTSKNTWTSDQNGGQASETITTTLSFSSQLRSIYTAYIIHQYCAFLASSDAFPTLVDAQAKIQEFEQTFISTVLPQLEKQILNQPQSLAPTEADQTIIEKINPIILQLKTKMDWFITLEFSNEKPPENAGLDNSKQQAPKWIDSAKTAYQSFYGFLQSPPKGCSSDQAAAFLNDQECFSLYKNILDKVQSLTIETLQQLYIFYKAKDSHEPKETYLKLFENFAGFATAATQEEKVSFLQKHLDQTQGQEYFDVLDHDFLKALELPTEHKAGNNILEAAEEKNNVDIRIESKDAPESRPESSTENQAPKQTSEELLRYEAEANKHPAVKKAQTQTKPLDKDETGSIPEDIRVSEISEEELTVEQKIAVILSDPKITFGDYILCAKLYFHFILNEKQTPYQIEASENLTSNLTETSIANSLLSIGTTHSKTSTTSASSSESASINLDMPAQLFDQTQEHLNTVANNQENESQKTILNKYHKNLFRLKTTEGNSYHRAGIAKDHNQLLATHRGSFRFSSPSFFSCTQSNGNKSIFPDDPLLATLDRLQREFNQLPGVEANQDINSSLKASNKDNIEYYMRFETTPDQGNFILCAKVMFLRELAKPSSNEAKPKGKTSQGLAFEKVKGLMNNAIIDLSTNTDEKISKKNQAYNKIYKKVFGDDSKPEQPKLAANYKDLLNLNRRHQFLSSLVKHKAKAGQEVIETIESRFSPTRP